MDSPKLEHLTIEGDVSVKPLAEKFPGLSYRFLLMGPTGAGKSSFLEALAGGPGTLGISKDQLAGYTQQVTAYDVVNVTQGSPFRFPVHLIDTPGFSDTKISEMEILNMVQTWMQKEESNYFDGVLYFLPVTGTRLPGSKRRTIEMLKAFLNSSQYDRNITFVTTMWDRLYNDRNRQRAESNFVQLRDVIFKGSVVPQFFNTQASALQVLDRARSSISGFCTTRDAGTRSKNPHLYQDLHERIECALQQIMIIESDLAYAETENNAELKALSIFNRLENEENLIKFIAHYADLGLAPCGFEHAAQRLRKAIAAEVTPNNSRCAYIFYLWARGNEFDCNTPTPHIFTLMYTVLHPLNAVMQTGSRLLRGI